MLSCEFCEVSKNTFFHRTPPVAASAWFKILTWPYLDRMITSGHYITKNSLKYKLYSNNLLALNDEIFSRCRRPGIFIYMMPSNVSLKFKKIWSTNFCSNEIPIKLIITILKYWEIKTQNNLFKIRTMDGGYNIQISIQFPEQNKTKINRKVLRNFPMEPHTLKSYALVFKK